MPCIPRNLYTGSTIEDACSATTTYDFWLSDLQIDIGVTAYTDNNCTVIAPDGFYRPNGYRQTWGYITGGDGIFAATGTCYDCPFTGYTTLVQQVTTFVSCCNSGHFFNIVHELDTFSVGETYYLDTIEFLGCATVVEPDYCYPFYSTVCGIEKIDCDECNLDYSITCPLYVCEVTRYVIDTGGLTPYDGVYTIRGPEGYNDHNYFIGDSAPNRYLFFDGIKWCLSDTLGGDCLLFGNETCNGACPDLCNLETWVCTTTTAGLCDVVDFDAIFECDPTPTPTPTPTVTPTITPTTTPTPTPTQTCFCCLTSITLTGTTLPGPTPTPTPTPSQTPPEKICFTGEIDHNIINSPFYCPPS